MVWYLIAAVFLIAAAVVVKFVSRNRQANGSTLYNLGHLTEKEKEKWMKN